MRPLMNNNIPVQYALPFTILLLFSSGTPNDLVTTTCKPTPDPALCEAALRADPRSSKAADNQGLILIMIDVVKTRFSESAHYMEDLTRETHDPKTTRAINKCIRVYGVVVDISIDLALRAVKQGVPKFGEQAMVDAGNEAEACRVGFPEGKVPGGLVERTRLLHGVSNVAASMIKTLE